MAGMRARRLKRTRNDTKAKFKGEQNCLTHARVGRVMVQICDMVIRASFVICESACLSPPRDITKFINRIDAHYEQWRHLLTVSMLIKLVGPDGSSMPVDMEERIAHLLESQN